MPFATDRFLLAYEPDIFEDISFGSQTRVNVADGLVSGTTLTSATADFTTAQIDAGSVLLINAITCEVISRTDANTVEISLPRAAILDNAIPPGDGSSLSVVGKTFANQAHLVYQKLLDKLGIIDGAIETAPTADQILSLDNMRRLESLGTLARIYTGAVAIGADNTVVLTKSQNYREQFDAACNAAVIQFDTNADGIADFERHLGTINWVRT